MIQIYSLTLPIHVYLVMVGLAIQIVEASSPVRRQAFSVETAVKGGPNDDAQMTDGGGIVGADGPIMKFPSDSSPQTKIVRKRRRVLANGNIELPELRHSVVRGSKRQDQKTSLDVEGGGTVGADGSIELSTDLVEDRQLVRDSKYRSHKERSEDSAERKNETVSPEPTKPHIVLILVDDLGVANVGFMAKQMSGTGAATFEASDPDYTPNIDSLAAEGVVVKRHYSYTSCTPTRRALISGRLPVHTGTLLDEPFDWDGGVNSTWGWAGLPPNFTTIGSKLKTAGYATHIVGKADGFGLTTLEHIPSGRGFDTSLVFFSHGTDYWNYQDTVFGTGAKPPCLPDKTIDLWDGDGPALQAATWAAEENDENAIGGKGRYREQIFIDRAVQRIQEHPDPASPLFLVLASSIPHTPLQYPQSLYENMSQRMCDFNPGCLNALGQCTLLSNVSNVSARLSTRPVGVCALPERIMLLSMVKFLDGMVGTIRDELNVRNMWENTVLVFMGDNGACIGLGCGGSNYPLYGGKPSDWEGGHRTPAFVSGGYLPQRVRGSTMNAVMHVTDWYATLLGLAGVDPRDPHADELGLPGVDAVDFWGAILGDVEEPRSEVQLSSKSLLTQVEGVWYKLVVGAQGFSMEQGPDYPNSTCPVGLTGCRPWNPAPFGTPAPRYDCGTGCLFDIATDPYEANDLGLDHAQILEDMQNRLEVLNGDYIEPFRGCLVQTASCETALRKWGGHIGPFVNVPDCPTCANTGNLPAAGVIQASHPCNCNDKRDCLGDGTCTWNMKDRMCDPVPIL